MVILLCQLTTEEIEMLEETGRNYPKRFFELDRSRRLHSVRFHLEEKKKEKVEVFNVEERDQKKRKEIIRTYIYGLEQKYIIVIDPQRTIQDYYLLTAYHIKKEYGEKKIKKMMQKKIPEIH